MEKINTYFVTARPNDYKSWRSFFIDVVIDENQKKIEHQIKKAIVDEYAIKSCYDVQISNISLINSKIK